MTARRFWLVMYWTLLIAFLGAAALGVQGVHAGFVTNHLADVTVPAWLYVLTRGLGPGRRTGNRLTHMVGRTPGRAAGLLFAASAVTEISQRYWPHGIFAGRFDPYDLLSYGIGVGACWVIERWWVPVPVTAEYSRS